MPDEEGCYLVCGQRPWNRVDFDSIIEDQAPGKWRFCDSMEDLEDRSLLEAKIHYIFFLHWSDLVPDRWLTAYNCVCFHMTDVPYGRGGSPLQNLIARGHRETMLTALRMTSELDAGPVYMKRPLSLEGSTAEEIFQRASRLSCQMAVQIARENPAPIPQEGEPEKFKRRKPEESRLPADLNTLQQVFDFVRMLDAEGYPPAFLEIGGLRLEFSRAGLYHDHVKCDVIIKPLKK